MKRSCWTAEQVISTPKEHEVGVSVRDISRRHGVAENTIYRCPRSDLAGLIPHIRNGSVLGVRSLHALWNTGVFAKLLEPIKH